MTKVPVYDVNGAKSSNVTLPSVFATPYMPVVITRAFWANMSRLRQRYGTNVMAGKRSSAHYHGHRDYRYAMMNKEMARLPRIHGHVGYMAWRARVAPQTVKGRRAHPPKTYKNWVQKVNKKERILAIKSAIAASSNKELVAKRGHKFNNDLPIVISDDFESMKKTKQVYEALEKLGLKDELARAREKKVRAGKGKARGRRYRRKTGPLIVVSKKCGLIKAARNLPGITVMDARGLNTFLLAPGAQAGRLTIFTKSSLTELEKRFL